MTKKKKKKLDFRESKEHTVYYHEKTVYKDEEPVSCIEP